ncbi:dTDP-4-dehydrorhamnose 3,5-epimerase [Pseudobacteriovorax antillogorgiicola]|uniref:dTDP-4-dehydrorhamnose 3,5-epimerase n=1 Tax=Pseudobacteriovorax antillogorgiicola TaxID=1513793 RepID=A0A1Y6CRD0_9BACT|nr:dTDP-4-dehydrorhamnose 3,5-epimerase [Pseudobacteriovorax antillogorgiicola]TCS46742.1 dTDP-4-dehydrorhamnose 3,5-epimerase [Pseudobacteriovorax antillogorgiicola]SMF67513.1 dTDP-4-dehydrorhamnose 3,5-epimerase [Pseudobacteriovorax antillogorgiicola]
MDVENTSIPDVKLVKPKIFGDHRGYFLETFHRDRYFDAGIQAEFVQDNLSKSNYGVLRGLHLQHPRSQGKLVSVIRGEVFDVAVDIRIGSPTFGKWVGVYLNETNKHQLWVPRGFAHGFVVTSDEAVFSYKCDEFYAPEHELSIKWDDPEIGIQWPVSEPKLSNKDQDGTPLKELNDNDLPKYQG